MQAENYQKQMEAVMNLLPRGSGLLIHTCCGPCSSSVLEQMAQHFTVYLYFYNPNIWPSREYDRRLEEQRLVLEKMHTPFPIQLIEGEYCPERFEQVAASYAAAPEGGPRCRECFALRLREAADKAKELGVEWFTTTLTVSPHKNSQLLNQLGKEIGEETGVRFLPSDFKKKEGYKRSLQLSAEMGLYRQEYCGCEYSYRGRFPEGETER